LYISTHLINRRTLKILKINKKPSIFTLALLVSFSSVLAVILTPALVKINEAFQSSDFSDYLIISFLFAYAIGQLFWSPITNLYGRKSAIYLGLTVHSLGVVLCLIAGYYHLMSIFVIGRVISGLGSSVGLCLSFTYVHEFFKEKEARRVVALIASSFAVAPGIGMAVGGILTTYISWEACFYFILLYTFFVMFLVYFLPKDELGAVFKAMKWSLQIESFYRTFCKPWILTFSLIGTFTTVFIYIYFTYNPYLAIQEYGLEASEYGWYILIVSFSYFCGNIFASSLSKYFSIQTFLTLGIIGCFLGITVYIIVLVKASVSLFSLFVLPAIITFFIPFAYSVAMSTAPRFSENKSAAASSQMFINMFTPSVIVLGASFIDSSYSLAIAIPLIIVGSGLMIFYIKAISLLRCYGK
jgi:DHA1 family bicyclomycin/chloramphenicol resistance-like MFS transporter